MSIRSCIKSGIRSGVKRVLDHVLDRILDPGYEGIRTGVTRVLKPEFTGVLVLVTRAELRESCVLILGGRYLGEEICSYCLAGMLHYY